MLNQQMSLFVANKNKYFVHVMQNSLPLKLYQIFSVCIYVHCRIYSTTTSFLVTHPNLKLPWIILLPIICLCPYVPIFIGTHHSPQKMIILGNWVQYFSDIFLEISVSCILYLSILNKKQILITIFQFRLFRLHEIVKREK